MGRRTDWPMIAKIGTEYHEDWMYDYESHEQTQEAFLVTFPPVSPSEVAAEIRRLFETTSSPEERYQIMIKAGGFVYGNLPEDPDDFLRSWLFAMELRDTQS
jgi:hypothetical protein